MGNRAELRQAMPAMLDHEGWWEGWYRDFDLDGKMIEERRVKTSCEFPDAGKWHYLQHNWLDWPDGRSATHAFGGRLDGDTIHWETDRFSGYGWQTKEHCLVLRLDRLDVPGSHYVEMINLVPGAQKRARTWQWFRGDDPWKRTLCDEWRIEPV